MPLIQWSDHYSVGIGDMDKHHQKLFDLLNRLHDAMIQGKAGNIITDIVDELISYTKYHFGEEEKLMARIKYSGLNEHKKAHQKFIVSVADYKNLANKGLTAFLSSGVSAFLSDWLRNHIGVMDKKYQKEMNANGIK
ncbi:MAG: hypothetical protein BWK80_50035 [Desulfobacteraceae bacterium IS3]|nr:MAG: hypothetical protein BWK80_50035 [Desulfobacteraceae bacterium IS3]